MNTNRYIPITEPDLTGKEKKYVNDCLTSSWISSKGKYIEIFEEKFANYVGTKYAVTTSNGTTALHLALVALGIGRGDEVIVPDLTFIACANTVTYTGATPIFVDVEKETWNLSPEEIKRVISKRTKAIMAVHLYGQPCKIHEIVQIAGENRLLLIEDAAEAHGAEVRINNPITQSTNIPIKQKSFKNTSGVTQRDVLSSTSQRGFPDGGEIWKKVGSIGDIGCFSFYGNKIITTGEGGMVVTDHKKLYEKMKILRDHGQDPKKRYYHPVIGFNYRMTNLQAAVGLAQLEKIDEFIKKKNEIARIYNNYVKKIKGITLPPSVGWAKNVFWLYSILVDKPYSSTRDELILKLEKNGIESRRFFYPLHFLPPYRRKNKYPVASYLSKVGLNLPSSVKLNKGDIERITSILHMPC